MEKITDLNQLKQLSDTLGKMSEVEEKGEKKAHAEFKPMPDETGFWAFFSNKGYLRYQKLALVKKNEERKTSFAVTIEVSPEIASVLYAEKTFIDKGQEKFQNDLDRAPFMGIKPGLAVGQAAISPDSHSLSHAAKEVSKTILEQASWSKQLREFRAQSNEVIGRIMGEYRLSKTDQGTYQLSLQDVGVREKYTLARSGGMRTEYVRCVPKSGIDESINPQELPAIPSGRAR